MNTHPKKDVLEFQNRCIKEFEGVSDLELSEILFVYIEEQNLPRIGVALLALTARYFVLFETEGYTKQ